MFTYFHYTLVHYRFWWWANLWEYTEHFRQFTEWRLIIPLLHVCVSNTEVLKVSHPPILNTQSLSLTHTLTLSKMIHERNQTYASEIHFFPLLEKTTVMFINVWPLRGKCVISLSLCDWGERKSNDRNRNWKPPVYPLVCNSLRLTSFIIIQCLCRSP